MRRAAGIALRALGYAWLTIGILLILVGYAGIFMKEGFWALWATLNPFNWPNTIAVIATILPGALLLAAASKVLEKVPPKSV